MSARAWHAAIAACSAYGPARTAERFGAASAASPRRISSRSQRRAVLVEQQHRLARGPTRAPQPRRLDLHQRDEAVDFRLLRRELGENSAQPQRVLAEGRPHPVVARGRGVALVEDEVDDLEHRRQTLGALGPTRHLEGNPASASVRFARTMRWATVGSGTRKARAISSVVRPAKQAERERDARLGRQDRVTGDEHQPQEVVAQSSSSGAGLDSAPCVTSGGVQLATELLVLAVERRRAGSGRSPDASRWP